MVNGRTTNNSRRAAGILDDDMVSVRDEGAEPTTATASNTAILQPVSYPVLRSVEPQKVAQFLKERLRYEDEVAEKKKEVPSMTIASYKVSIDRTLLDNMHFMGRFDKIVPNKTATDLTSEDIETFIKQIVAHHDGVDVNPTVIQEACTRSASAHGDRRPQRLGCFSIRVIYSPVLMELATGSLRQKIRRRLSIYCKSGSLQPI